MNKKLAKFLINFVPSKKLRHRLREKYINCIYVHPKAASNPESMLPFVDWINNWSKIKPKIIFEIGANYGQDAAGLQKYFNCEPQNIYLFEANPDICREIPYAFNKYDYAVFNEEKEMTFNAIDVNQAKNTGVSTLLDTKMPLEKTKQIKVRAIRMDKFMQEHNIPEVDFLKLDVEGCNWEVLDGFGERLKDVKAIHIEAEHEEEYANQKLFNEIKQKLETCDFVMVYFSRSITQSDSFWVQKCYIKNKEDIKCKK